MPDLEKVIEGLEAMREFFGFGLPSQSPVFEAYQNILTDALALLKEQEPVKPIIEHGKMYPQCGNCGEWLLKSDKYCSACGRKVLWE